MGTKNNPGKYDCYAKLDGDEPYFVLRAKDPLAATLVRSWAEMLGAISDQTKDNVAFEKAIDAMQCAIGMENWRKNNGLRQTIF